MNCGTLRTFKQRRISRLAKSDIRPCNFGHVSEKFRPEYAERSGFRGGRCIAPAGRAEGTSNPSTAMTISQQTFCSKIDPEDTPGTEADRALPVPAGPKAHQIHQMLQIMAISGSFINFSLSGEGVPALHSVLATSLVWRHTSDFVTSKACRVRSLRAVAQAILKAPKCLPRAFRTACGLAARRQRPSSSLVTSRACRFRSLRAVAKHIKSIKCIKWQLSYEHGLETCVRLRYCVACAPELKQS